MLFRWWKKLFGWWKEMRWVNIVHKCIVEGDLEQAEQLLEEKGSSFPLFGWLYHGLLGLEYYRRQHYEKAIGHLTISVRHDEHRHRLDNAPDIRKSLGSVIERDSARCYLIISLLHIEDMDRAKSEILKLEKRTDTNDEALKHIEVMLNRTGLDYLVSSLP